jgi:hypothetical protein
MRYPLVEALVGLLFAGDYLIDVALDCRDLCDRGLTSEMARMLGEPTALAVLVALAFMARDATMGGRRWGRSRP